MNRVTLLCINVVGSAYAMLHTDAQALEHCLRQSDSFVAIIWPIAQGNEYIIKKILNKYGTIWYQKNIFLDKASATRLLQEAHPHVPANLPHCSSIKQHVHWYFPSWAYEHPARIFLMSFPSLQAALRCKYTVRKLFPKLQYRSIHVTDYHREAVSLAKILFV